MVNKKACHIFIDQEIINKIPTEVCLTKLVTKLLREWTDNELKADEEFKRVRSEGSIK